MAGDFDIAVIGSGFAGSLVAMIARRLGHRVVLIERGRHPRFAIGESSTPLANLLLESLGRRYDLPRLLPLTKWGSWQRTYPHLPCGLKRGFTFYHHTPGGPPIDVNDRSRQLLVAASPRDEIADTHWYRPAFDQFLVLEAQSLGVEFLEDVQLTRIDISPGAVRLEGKGVSIRTQFVIDATGPRGFLHRALRLAEEPFTDFPATQALYAHFKDVGRLPTPAGSPPYQPEDAAVHHVFDGGWVWMLRFKHGIVSAGIAATNPMAEQLRLADGASAWQRVLTMLPTLGPLVAAAAPVSRFVHVPCLAFRSREIVGDRWALLPSAAGFVDPLLSTGFPLMLLGIERLAVALESRDPSKCRQVLDRYALLCRAELEATSRLVAALYSAMGDFDLFRRLSLLYFVAASFSEMCRRLGRDSFAFLLHDHPTFGPACRACCDAALQGRKANRQVLLDRVQNTVEQVDVAGLLDPSQDNWFPVDPEDTVRAAPKLNVTPQEVRAVLKGLGMLQS